MLELNSRLKKICDIYGSDRSKWDWRVLAHFKCRARNATGLLASQLISDLANKVKQCPTDTQIEEVVTPHPADNVAGVIAATDFPEACKLCKMKPQWYDFRIK